MALRVVETFVPENRIADVMALLRQVPSEHVWSEPAHDGGGVVRAVVGVSRTGRLIDQLYERFSTIPSFRVLVLPLDAMLPRPRSSGSKEDRQMARSSAGVSREEVHAKVADAAETTANYLAMTVLATIVAAIGLASGNEAAVIGAMVVAPLLGPNMGLALGLTLADGPLVRAAVRSNLAGFSVAYTTTLVLGLWLEVDPTVQAIVSRTELGLPELVLALAAGCAGTLAYTSGAPSYLIGVMVAVAILPPTVASGLLLVHGHSEGALRALLLVAANVVGINLAGMVTFLVKGMRPRAWWRAERARGLARRGLVAWLVLLALLVTAIVLSGRWAG